MKLYLNKRTYILGTLKQYIDDFNKLANSIDHKNISVKRQVFFKIERKVMMFVRQNISVEEAEVLDPQIRCHDIGDPCANFFREDFKPLQDKLIALAESVRDGHVKPANITQDLPKFMRKAFLRIISDWKLVSVLLAFVLILIFIFKLPQKIINIKKIGPGGVDFFEKTAK